MKSKLTFLSVHRATVACALFFITSNLGTQAAEIVKTNDANALNLGTSWVGGTAPGSGDVALYDSTLTTARNSAIGDDASWAGIKVATTGGAHRIGNSGTGTSGKILTIGSSGIDMSAASQNFNVWAGITLAANQTWNVASGRSLTIDGWGTSGGNGLLYDFDLGGHELTKSGVGTLNILNGYGLANGTLKITAGTIQFSAGNNRVTGLAANASVQVDSAASVSVQNNISTTFTAGGVTKNSVDAVIWNGEVNLNGGRFNISYGATSGDLNIGGSIVANSGTTSEIIYATASGSTAPQFQRDISAAITGTGTIDFKANNTTRLIDRITLMGDNSGFQGTARINGTTASSSRTIRIGAASAGSSSAAWEIAANNTLEVHGVNVNFGSLSGTGTLKNSSSTDATVIIGEADSDSTFNGVIDAGAGVINLVKTGAGRLTLGGVSTFTGKTTVNGGVLSINLDNRLGVTPGSNVADQLILNGGTLASSAAFTIGGTRGTQLGANGGTIDTAAATTLTMWSPISGAGSLTKTGEGTLLLNSYNSFNGGFLISEGAVTTAATVNRFNPGNAITVSSGASLTINASQGIGSLAGGGSVDLATGTLTLGGAASTTFSGIITGSGGLTRSGAGTLTLTGTNEYSGNTSVTAGNLIIGNEESGSATNSAFTISGTGTLSGSGTIGALIVNNGGTVAPGLAIGTLNTSTVTMAAGSTLAAQVNSADGTSDTLAVNGDLTLDEQSLLTLTDLATAPELLPVGSKLTLATYTGTLSGTFEDFPEGATVLIGENEFILSYEDSNAITLTSTNETSADPFEEWIDSFLALTDPADKEKGADPDGDGRSNFEEFAFDGDPTQPANDGKIQSGFVTIEGLKYITLTIPVRDGAVFAGSPGLDSGAVDGLIYGIRGSYDLSSFNAGVVELSPAIASEPPLNPGWSYRSFRLSANSSEQPRGFLRAEVTPEDN